MRLNTFPCIYLSIYFIFLWTSIHVLCPFFGLFLLNCKFDVFILMPSSQFFSPWHFWCLLASDELLSEPGMEWASLQVVDWNGLLSGSWSCWQRQGSPGRTRTFVSQIPDSGPFSLSEGPIHVLALIMTFSKVRIWFEALSLGGEWVPLTQRLFQKVEDPENSDLLVGLLYLLSSFVPGIFRCSLIPSLFLELQVIPTESLYELG